MYTDQNFKTKKAFKQAVDAWNTAQANIAFDKEKGAQWLNKGEPVTPEQVHRARPVTYYQPGPFGGNEPQNGKLYFEGPHYPEAHRWYAQAEAKDGVIVKVK